MKKKKLYLYKLNSFSIYIDVKMYIAGVGKLFFDLDLMIIDYVSH